MSYFLLCHVCVLNLETALERPIVACNFSRDDHVRITARDLTWLWFVSVSDNKYSQSEVSTVFVSTEEGETGLCRRTDNRREQICLPRSSMCVCAMPLRYSLSLRHNTGRVFPLSFAQIITAPPSMALIAPRGQRLCDVQVKSICLLEKTFWDNTMPADVNNLCWGGNLQF